MFTGRSYAGWKAIAERLGVRDVDTAKRRVKKYSIPVIKLGRNPVLDEVIYRVWLADYLEISKEMERESAPPVADVQKSGPAKRLRMREAQDTPGRQRPRT